MDRSLSRRDSNDPVTNRSIPKPSHSTDLLAKIRPFTPSKPNLVQHLSRSNPIQVSSGLKMLSTRIPSTDDPSYQPLVTISDNEHSDSEENFVSPIHKLTKTELREELNAFNANAGPKRHGSNYALLAHGDDNDDDDDDDEGTTDIQFRTHEAIKRSVCCHSYLVTLKDNLCAIS